jgi:DNA-binding NtrC family response regulator
MLNDMIGKNIILFERYDGVRFVLERSLSNIDEDVTIHASCLKNEVKKWIDCDETDLLITELSRVNPEGIEISRYARENFPDLQIIWITVLGCNVFKDARKALGNILCIEKPLAIEDFRQSVLKALDI